MKTKADCSTSSFICMIFACEDKYRRKKEKKKKRVHWPGIGPGSPAWQASILPLNHQCLLLACMDFLFDRK